MRIVTGHEVNPANSQLRMFSDDATHGNAAHLYTVMFPDNSAVEIAFQNGPVSENGNGVNGLTHEALLTIVADRLRGFQSGPYACRENALMLTKIEEALHWSHHRTLARMQRGVEGTHEV